MKKRKHVTVPRIHNPGKGRPAETLAYLSPIEHELIRQLTDGTYERGPGGIRSYADDSASSNGVSRGDNSGTKGSGGLGQGGQGGGSQAGGSKASGSPNSGTSTGGTSASKSSSSSSQSSSTSGAGRDSSRGIGQGAGGSAIGRGPSTALGQASQAAQSNAARASGTATQWGGRSYSSPQTAGNGSYYGPKGGNALNTDARMAAARSVGFNAPAVSRTPGDAEMLGRMMMAESGSIRNKYGNPNTFGLQGVADVVRNRMASERFPDTVPGVLNQRKQFSPIGDGSFARTPANAMATRVAESVLAGESPSIVGNALNYGNLDTINNKPGYSSAASRAAFNSMTPTATIADARNPNSLSHTFGTIGRPSDVAFNGPGGYNPGFGGTQVAGIANAGLSQVAAQERAKAAAAGAAAVAQGFGAGPVQGPQRYSGPLDSIPAPRSMGMTAPPSAFAQDPRLGMPRGGYPAQAQGQIATDPRLSQTPIGGYPAARAQPMVAGDPRVSQTPVGGYPQARQPSQVSTDPRVSQTPVGAFPAAPKPASVFAQDPRLASPLGAYPAAPEKEVKLAWNVPPLGGAMSASPEAWAGFGKFGANRPMPQGPAAIQGTIHSQTAQAEEKPSFWEQGANLIKAGTDKVNEVTADPRYQKFSQFAKDHPKLAEFGIKMMMGGGGKPSGLLGNPQDRSDRYFAPPQMPQAMQPQQQTAEAPAQDQLSQLLLMQEQMIASGADPEELAAVQALIDQLTTQEA